ncbi:MAG: PBSX family phage terminase large subunit, partial [Oscillospiraceae bacterium]
MIRFECFSQKQLKVLSWWSAPKTADFDAIICDGAIRSGKTLCMSVSFTAWAMSEFDNSTFALCGKTITALRRNVITPLLEILRSFGMTV